VKILVQFPTRGRPAACLRVWQAYWERQQRPDLVSWHFVVDADDDDTARCIAPGLERGGIMHRLTPGSGKIAACNFMLEALDWDICILVSDDMVPQVPGWDQIIRDDMARHWPDTDGVLHYNDGTTGDRLCTLAVVGRRYFARDGYIYHPSYRSLWCDNEFTDVARARGRHIYIDRCIIRHCHPGWGLAPNDDLYRANNRHDDADHANYDARKAAGFPHVWPL
jgi:hypothetical protein